MKLPVVSGKRASLDLTTAKQVQLWAVGARSRSQVIAETGANLGHQARAEAVAEECRPCRTPDS